jgi:hypothetical protein
MRIFLNFSQFFFLSEIIQERIKGLNTKSLEDCNLLYDSNAILLDFIPERCDKSSIKVLRNTPDSFTLEYSIFEPKTINISMHVNPRRRFFIFRTLSGIATLQQFVTGLGLHADFLKKGGDPIKSLIQFLKPKFNLNSTENRYYCGGLLGIRFEPQSSFSQSDGFINNILELLTEDPQFAFLQLGFTSHNIPKEFRSDEEPDYRTQFRFDIQQGRVEQRSRPVSMNLMEESGCFKFSIRVLLVETSEERLSLKLERLKVFLKSKGIITRGYPAFLRSFQNFKSQLIKRSINPGMVIDGNTLMNYLTLPTHQYSLLGYQMVPNKDNYKISTNVLAGQPDNAIRIGIPILSGKTTNSPALLAGKDLSRHMAVFGMTGEGKSRYIFSLIKEFYENNVKFLIIDPKGEYIYPIQSFCNDFIYIKPGSESFPWGINIFQIPIDHYGDELISPDDHIQFVISLIENIFGETDNPSPQMRRLLQLATIQTIKEKGDFQTFLKWLNKPSSLGLAGAYLESTSAGAVNRISKLLYGNIGRCFSVSSTTIDISQFLQKNVILDLSAFEAMEDLSGRHMLLEIIFQYLFYFIRKFRPPYKEQKLPQNVFVLDEINKLIPTQNKRYSSPKSIIARGPWTLRSYDVSMIFVGTDPIIDLPMLTNAGIIAMFYSKFDPFKVANLLGVSQTEYLQLKSILKAKDDERRCMISVNKSIMILKTDDFELVSHEEPIFEKLKRDTIHANFKAKYEEFSFSIM